MNNPKHIRLNPSSASASFNPATSAHAEGNLEWLADFLSTLAQVELTSVKREALIKVLAATPPGASLADLITRVKEHEAEQLGIPVEHYDALAPLFEALSSVNRDGRFGTMFALEPQAGNRTRHTS